MTIVIPNWNGRELLEQNLPAVQAAARAYPGVAGITVVDDGSTDGSADMVDARMPGVTAIRRQQNGGFAAACRTGIEAAETECVVLLNSDVEPRPDFLQPLLAHFEDPNVFAVSCLGLLEDGTTPGEGAKEPVFARGLLRLRNSFPEGPGPTFFAVGGHCALSRSRFLELGGFDDLFRPFYWEDVDLCYRAWKRGWKTIFEPHSRVIHRHRAGAIAQSFRRRTVTRANRRNRLLFLWKNIGPEMLARKHIPVLALRTLLGFAWFDFSFYPPLFMALSRLPSALRGRAAARQAAKLGDREIFGQFYRTGHR